MSLTPDQPIPPKTGSTNLLRGLRDRFRGKHLRSSSQPDVSSIDDGSPTTGGCLTPGSTAPPSFFATPPISPSTFSPQQASIAAPPIASPSNFSPQSSWAIASPPPTGPAISSPQQPGARAPPAPALHREWAQLSLPPSDPSTSEEADTPTEIRNLPQVFAVDVSGSTRGRCLDQEKAVIAHMAGKIESAILASQSHILPWDGRSYGSMSPAQVRSLQSGAGTDPSVVLKNAQSRYHLQQAKLWFLMTDGYIEEPLVNKFANAISSTGLHGTASVIILFGYRLRSPFECNVSVGMSVFAVAPHCVFLFHDVRTGAVYVFQAKGSFTSLLPGHSRFTSFGPTTRWEDLTQITYDDLSTVRVPSPTILSRDVVVLPGGKKFDMSSIYNNTMSAKETLELLSDYSALDVILLAAKTRGKGSSVKLWLETARRTHKMPEVAFWEREDINSQGKRTMIRLLQAVLANQASDQQPEDLWRRLASPTSQETGNPPNTLDESALVETAALRSMLRLQHVQNWSRFEARVDADWELSCKLDETLTEVLSTMSIHDHQLPVSPAMLTPMSSPVEHHQAPYTGAAESFRQVEPRRSPLSPQPPTAHGSQPLPSGWQPRARSTDLLFLPGFKGERISSPGFQSALYDTCSICRQPNSIQTLLLQASSDEPETQHLPNPGQKAGHKYPFVLGNYPETDVILPITCCDACAFLLLQAGELPNGDRVTMALPLVSLQVKENRNLWEEKLGEVYGQRFHQRIVTLVFLSTLCTTFEDLIDNAEPPNSPTLRSLKWCCKELSQLPGISTRAGLTPVGSPLLGVVNDNMPLQQTLHVAFCGFHSVLQEDSLLAYPMDGFLVLIRLAGLMEDIEPKYIERFVWRRLLYYFAEQHADLQRQVGVGEAKTRLDDLIHEPSAAIGTVAETESEAFPKSSRAPTPRIRRHVIPLSFLEGTYLIPSSSDILEQFERMGEHFTVIQGTAKYHPALAVFLHILATLTDGPSSITDVEGFFVKIQYRTDGLVQQDKGLHDVFGAVEPIDEDVAARLIAAARDQAKDSQF
ncbi:hypothetical protein QQX98_007334 [Neonectria punicea]|uniref:Uncharacterized protein n=1 Tax=Neonectria punicea TaxID=979145 RepID=A0ABR1GYD1_9HYPO